MTSPPEGLPQSLLALASFPKDGRLRWLRWFDDVDASNVSGEPTIQALLTPMPDGAAVGTGRRLADVAPSGDGSSPYVVGVGSLPSMRLGGLFHDGRHVGDLPMEASGPMAFGHSDGVALVRADGDNPAARPDWWSKPWKVLPVTRYPLGPLCGSRVLAFTSRTHQAVVPCSEVFRVLCAPDTRLAEALLSGPWPAYSGRVVNEA